MAIIRARDIKVGAKIVLDNTPYIVLDNSYFSPGKGKPVSRIKVKSLLDGKIFSKTFRSTDNLELGDIVEIDVKFLYYDGKYNFLDVSTLETYEMLDSNIGNLKDWLVINESYIIILWNDLPITLKIPKIITLKVISTEDIAKNTVVAKNMKNSILETGVSIKLPLFIKVNDMVRVDTEKFEYLSRVN